MKVFSAVLGLAAFAFIAILVPDYFPYMRLIMGLIALIFTLVIIGAEWK